jgi:phenylpyruvate tautomerase PptA (4-oxalocrotonate tautomerase family)
MRHEVHLHADIPILEGVSRRQLEQALAPLLEYLDADGLADVKSLEPDEPGLKYDEKELLLTVCWTGEIGRSFHPALEAALENVGPFCYEAVEVDLTLYHDNGEQESKLLFVGPTARAIHEAQRRCMVEDVAAVLGRQFGKDEVTQVTTLVNEMFDRDWKNKASQEKKPERAFETYPRPSRKNLH